MTRPRKPRKPETIALDLLTMATPCRCDRLKGEHAGYCPGEAYDRLLDELARSLKQPKAR